MQLEARYNKTKSAVKLNDWMLGGYIFVTGHSIAAYISPFI